VAKTPAPLLEAVPLLSPVVAASTQHVGASRAAPVEHPAARTAPAAAAPHGAVSVSAAPPLVARLSFGQVC